MSSTGRKHSFAEAAAKSVCPDKEDHSGLPPKAPLTPPLSDPVPSSAASPTDGKISKSSPKSIPPIEPEWKTVGSPRRDSLAAATEPESKLLKPESAEIDNDYAPKWGNLWAPGGSIWNNSQAVGRQNRSLSFTLQPVHEHNKLFDHVETQPLKDEDSFDPYVAPKIARSRSKSSSAIFGVLGDSLPTPSIKLNGEPADMNSIWAVPNIDPLRANSLMRRRSSTQPNDLDDEWENEQDLIGLSNEEIEAFRNHRRFSHAPTSIYNEAYTQQLLQRNTAPAEDFPLDMRRRHSLAGPLYAPGSSDKYLAEALNKVNLNASSTYEDINDYFENTENRTRAWVEAGKNLQMQSLSQNWPLYVVEFKAGRTDFFYVADLELTVKKGDLCIVEADRGKDLGKVIHDNIQNMQQLQLFQQNHVDPLAESQQGKDIHPKKIYRLALPTEISMLVSKGQDEAKAMQICQGKIRQKKLPMEIVDAEYQWDRRKLTLYFVADRRIDFRELVRDLFKIYKTRIWMCAVNPLKNVSPTQTAA